LKKKIVKIGMILFCFLCIFSITACKKQKTYQIIYEVDENNPSSNYTIQFNENETVKLDIPQKEGYIFVGWYQDKTLVTSITNQNYCLKAKWKKVYTIEYELNGGKLEDSYPTTFIEDEKVDLPIPVRSGYTFMGWYQDETLITSVINQSYHLNAKWKKVYTIEYELNGGTLEDSYSTTFIEDEKVDLPTPVRSGYAFMGWYQDETLITSVINQNYHLNAKWKKVYTIKYELNGGTLEDNYPITFIEDEKVDLPTPVRSGYEFMGWYQGNKLITDISNQSYHLNAKWERVYQITYVIDDGVMPEEYIKYYHVEQEEKLPIPKREGYQFIGWKEKPTSKRTMLIIPISYEEDLTLYPSWEKITYRIQYQFPNQIYINKEELFIDFFSDFYDYIVNYLGKEDVLKQKGVNNLNDFLSIAGAWNGGAAGMGQIGNLAGSYYLRIDVGGDIRNQTAEDGFIGYCLENNRYVEFIYFLQDFFYWWRLDEGYTGGSSDPNNTGSDFLASAWASLVDTAKFFYYEKDTLPSYFISKGHIPEMYDRIPYIVKTQNTQLVYEYDWEVGLSLPNDLQIEGYSFLGWYDNPECTGSPLTVLEANIYHDITLYAKLEKKQK